MHRISTDRALACCHGYRVAAGELDVGAVETPIFTGPAGDPDFLLVRTTRFISGTFRVVPVGLVIEIDRDLRRVAIAGDGAVVAGLPERLPMRGRAGTGAGAH